MVDAPEILQRLNAAAPAPLVSRARKARLVGERKPVTAVFADIVGSTALAERIDPEDWTMIINAAFDEMSRCIFDYEGTIAQLQGDAMVSFFGAPIAHEDDPERAVRSALAMTRAIEDYGEQLRRRDGIDFRIRVGISTGLVLVGNVGSDLRYDYTAIGDTMNLASRLQGAALPGSILIADRTQRFVEPFFDLENMGPLELKGKADSVTAFRVIGERAQPGSARGVEGLESPLVGRARELELLSDLAMTVQAGRGRMAVLVAEPGIGKSRLLGELRHRIEVHDRANTKEDGLRETAWVTGQSLSYGANMPFHVINSLLLDTLGLSQTNSTDEIRSALRDLIDRLVPGDDEVYRYLADLMGLEATTDDGDHTKPTGEFRFERLSGAILRLFREVAEQGPLVIVAEDLHWADAASIDILKALLTLPDDTPILLIGTTRDEPGVPGWEVLTAARERLGRALSEIRLEPLDRLGSQILVANLLHIDSIPMPTRDLILDKAEGNPLFMEEVIRMLLERDAIRQEDGRWVAAAEIADVPIPDTVHGLVLARIDRLPADARNVLRLASCIDRRFSLAILEDVARAGGIEAGIGTALGRLEAAGLLVLAASEPELEYRFSHALIQDAAYETVLRQERREWHRFTADALLSRYPDRADELSDRLARHFELAGDYGLAVRYLLTAANRATERNAMIEARSLYEHAEQLMKAERGTSDGHGAASDHGPESDEEQRDRQRVQVALGRIASGLELLTVDQAWAILADGQEAAERVGDRVGLSDLLFWEVMLHQAAQRSGMPAQGMQRALDRSAELADVSGNTLQRSLALSRSGLFLWWSGEFAASLEVLGQAAHLFEERGDDIGAAMAESYMAASLASLGDFDKADEHMAASHRLSEGADLLARLDYHLAEAALAALRGDYGTSIRFAAECFAGSTELGALGCATVSGIVLGASQMATGAIDEARTSLEHSIELATQGYLAPQRMQGSVLLASVEGMAGDLGKAESGFRAAMQALAHIDSPYGDAQARFARGLVLANHPDGDASAALDDLDVAFATFQRLGARPSQARALRARGMALTRLERPQEAGEALAEAATMATAMGLMDQPWPATAGEVRALRSEPPPIQAVE